MAELFIVSAHALGFATVYGPEPPNQNYVKHETREKKCFMLCIFFFYGLTVNGMLRISYLIAAFATISRR